jgi:hypothetical protein
MNIPMNASLRLLLTAAAIFAGSASAAEVPPTDTCRLYGYVPRTRDYAECRMNVRRYWSTGPCRDSQFAAVHREYCHLYPPHDF